MQDDLTPLEKEKAAARKKYNEAGKKTDELKNKADAAKDLTKRHNNGELWLNPYGGKSPLGDGINYPKSGSTIRMDENAPGRLNPNNKK